MSQSEVFQKPNSVAGKEEASVKPGKYHWQFVVIEVGLVLCLFLIVAPRHASGSFAGFLMLKAVSLSILLLPVAINQFVLVPWFLKKNKWLYAGMLLKLLMLFALIGYLRYGWIGNSYVPLYIGSHNPLASFIFEFASLLLVIGISMLLKQVEQLQQEKENTYLVKQNKLESEIEFLKLQISPHFYFNVMNSIYHSIKIDPQQAEDIVLQLSEVMKYHIYDSSKEKVELEHELQNIHHYIGLQKMRLSSNPKINFDIKGEVQNKYIAPLILTSLVENSFKNGIEPNKKNSFLNLELEVHDTALNLRIINSRHYDPNGNGSIENGLSTVRSRLDLLYPLRHELIVSENANESAVVLALQMN